MNDDTRVKKVTPGFRSILVSEAAFDKLKKLQRLTYGHQSDPNGVRFDLKDVVSAVVLEALEIEDLPQRALDRTARTVFSSLNIPKE
ncbi:hypothetical protein EZJ19_00985 [Parasulfuritortus cantonensis]|uniref:Uncharacterized protein n=1 Tax=Parasulfuritortus cantonensis TaxID=2528202 RepID=A0A4R1BQZ1_9PROT|nr:hypothetical protein [Parasulfuritortus cantonensis]TCJ20179.1 hypothetical protein EZJ19_00985 [Parasulfuritortus cantonensis]